MVRVMAFICKTGSNNGCLELDVWAFASGHLYRMTPAQYHLKLRKHAFHPVPFQFFFY